jgi:ketosteroid isomerase-like protein
MSEENVELVRQVYEASARRDSATVLSLYDPDVEVDVTHGAVGEVAGPTVHHGHDGLRTFFRAWYEAWESADAELHELLDAGEHVVSIETTRARGKGSGVEVELTQYGVWTIRERKIVRVAWLTSRKEALKAAGLSDSQN